MYYSRRQRNYFIVTLTPVLESFSREADDSRMTNNGFTGTHVH